jgi:hypothetical protein
VKREHGVMCEMILPTTVPHLRCSCEPRSVPRLHNPVMQTGPPMVAIICGFGPFFWL